MERDDAVLRDIVGYNLTRANAAVLSQISRILEPFGLRRGTFSALAVISAREGLRQADLAEALAIDRPNMGLTVVGLEEAGLITKARSDVDRRAYALRITLKGQKLFERANVAVRAFDEAMTGALSRVEREQLIDLLSRLEGHLKMSEGSDD